jgi:hypothetical protein
MNNIFLNKGSIFNIQFEGNLEEVLPFVQQGGFQNYSTLSENDIFINPDESIDNEEKVAEEDWNLLMEEAERSRPKFATNMTFLFNQQEEKKYLELQKKLSNLFCDTFGVNYPAKPMRTFSEFEQLHKKINQNLIIFFENLVPQDIQNQLEGELNAENIRDLLLKKNLGDKKFQVKIITNEKKKRFNLEILPLEVYLLRPQKIHLTNCGLRIIPNSIKKMVYLNELYLSNNQIESMPKGLEKLPQNQLIVDLSNNRIKNYPDQVGSLKHWEKIEYDGVKGIYMTDAAFKHICDSKYRY